MTPIETLSRAGDRDAFARFGMADSVYVKRVTVDGEAAYAVHAADGSFLRLFLDDRLARVAVQQSGLTPFSVH